VIQGADTMAQRGPQEDNGRYVITVAAQRRIVGDGHVKALGAANPGKLLMG